MSALVKGQRVTNANGWHGRIDHQEKCPTCPGGFYYWVYWEERANHAEKIIARRPIIGHLEDQIWPTNG